METSVAPKLLPIFARCRKIMRISSGEPHRLKVKGSTLYTWAMSMAYPSGHLRLVGLFPLFIVGMPSLRCR
jgi:hypothetical protein